MSVSLPLTALLDWSDYERRRWREWIAADPARLSIAFQPGKRFPTIAALFDHLFLVERRHLSRLEGATPPDATGVPDGDWRALFEYGDLVRADLRKYVTDLDDEKADESFTFTVPAGAFSPTELTFTVTRRKLAAHILLHEVRHLAQVAFAARAAGHEPPGQHDYFFFPGPA